MQKHSPPKSSSQLQIIFLPGQPKKIPCVTINLTSSRTVTIGVRVRWWHSSLRKGMYCSGRRESPENPSFWPVEKGEGVRRPLNPQHGRCGFGQHLWGLSSIHNANLQTFQAGNGINCLEFLGWGWKKEWEDNSNKLNRESWEIFKEQDYWLQDWSVIGGGTIILPLSDHVGLIPMSSKDKEQVWKGSNEVRFEQLHLGCQLSILKLPEKPADQAMLSLRTLPSFSNTWKC